MEAANRIKEVIPMPTLDRISIEGGQGNGGQGGKIEERIKSAYFELAGFQWGLRVMIADLKKFLSNDLPGGNLHDKDIDTALRRMQLSDHYHLVLYPLDDPRQVQMVPRIAVTLRE